MGVRHGVWRKKKWQLWEGPREQWWEQCVVQNWWREKDGGPNEDVGIEGNSGSDEKGKWNEMVWACIGERWWACVEKSVGVWSEGQEEARTTKEDMEVASGEGKQKC